MRLYPLLISNVFIIRLECNNELICIPSVSKTSNYQSCTHTSTVSLTIVPGEKCSGIVHRYVNANGAGGNVYGGLIQATRASDAAGYYNASVQTNLTGTSYGIPSVA